MPRRGLFNLERYIMAEKKKNHAIVRGMTKDWFIDHFKEMKVYFGGDPRGIPAYDADFIGFYLEAPDSAITHIGVVDKIVRERGRAIFYLKAIIKLDVPKKVPSHPIRKQEYKSLEYLGIEKLAIIFNGFSRVGSSN
jgi:hypothetical protein